MGERLERVMKEHLGVTMDDVKKMSESELAQLYDKACDYEVEKAMEAGDGETKESIDAAKIVDWLYSI